MLIYHPLFKLTGKQTINQLSESALFCLFVLTRLIYLLVLQIDSTAIESIADSVRISIHFMREMLLISSLTCV